MAYLLCKVYRAFVAVIQAGNDINDDPRRFRIRDRIVKRSCRGKLDQAIVREGGFNGISRRVRRVRRFDLVIPPVVLDDFADGVVSVIVGVFVVFDHFRRLQDRRVGNDVRSGGAILHDLRFEG